LSITKTLKEKEKLGVFWQLSGFGFVFFKKNSSKNSSKNGSHQVRLFSKGVQIYWIFELRINENAGKSQLTKHSAK
jgi:hypothetical protein